MASQPIDQGAILASGRAVVPDYAADLIRRQLAGAQVQEAQAAATNAVAHQSAEARAASQQAAYQAAVANLPANPTAADFARLMVAHPAFSEAINRGYSTLDSAQQRQTFQSLAEINAAARSGDYSLAARLLRTRDEADTAAGHPPDPIHSAIQSALESSDPAQQQIGRDLLERTTAAVAGPEHYSSVYGTFQRNLREMNGILYDDEGNAVVQDPRGRIIPGSNGSFYQEQPLTGVPMLGAGATAPAGAPAAASAPAPAAPAPQAAAPNGSLPRNGQSMPLGMFQGWQVIGVPGDPRRRAGGREVPHNGVDFRPPASNPHLVADRPLEIVSTQPDHGISGITAIVRFPDGAEFNMMHLAAQPRPGRYDAGQVIATAGNTGNARNGSTQIHVQPWGATRHDPRAYFGRGVGSGSSPVRVRTVQQAQALPPGTEYITPDNRHMVR